MPKFSKQTATDVREMGPVTDRREVMNGYTAEFVFFAADADLDGPLQALPGGSCQCPHWGYVISGRMRFVFGNERLDADVEYVLDTQTITFGNRASADFLHFKREVDAAFRMFALMFALGFGLAFPMGHEFGEVLRRILRAQEGRAKSQC